MTAAAALHPMNLCLAKLGDARFLGHLDFARIVERSLRRAGLPVRYTEGFNPRIKLAFSEAMPLGVASEGEWVTMNLEEDLAPEVVRARLAAALPRVVQLVDVRRGSPPSPTGPVRYRLDVLGCAGSATDALIELLERDVFLVEDPRKRRSIDIRPHLLSGESKEGCLELELVAVDGRPPRPGPMVRALEALAQEAGSPPPGFGTATRLLDVARRQGDDQWADAVTGPRKGPASSSSTPASPRRAALPS
jgi:radical SAM-linked protein